jgi:predicted DNA-binding transcriptional regulator
MRPDKQKQMMAYLTRPAKQLVETGQLKFASDLAKPVDKFEVQQIKLFNEFNRRNSRADGGRIGFADGPPGKFTEKGVTGPKGGRPIPDHVIMADDRLALKEARKKIDKLNRVNKLDGKGVRFVINKTQAGNFTPALSYTAEPYMKVVDKKLKSGPIEELKKEFNQFKKTDLFKNYTKTAAMQAAGVKSAKKQLKDIGSKKEDIFKYLLNNKNATIEEIAKDLKIKDGVVRTSLQGLYTDIYKRVGDQGAVYLKDFNSNQLDSVHGSIKNTKVPLKDRVKNLVIDAYKGDKNLKPLLEKLDNFYTLQSEIKKTPYGKFFAANLDHPVPLNFIRQLEEGADPFNLIKIKPVPEFLNQRAFKAQFDRVLGTAYRTGNKKALEAIVNLQSYLPQEFGGITKTGKIIDYGAKPFSLKTNLSQTDFPEVYKRVFNFIKNPELQETFKKAKVSFKSLAGQEKNIMNKAGGYLKELENLNAKGFTVNAKIPLIEDLYNMAKTIPGDIAKKSFLKAGFKTLGVAAAPLVAYDTYKAFEQGKPILEALEQGFIGTDMIGGTKRVLSLKPEEREARSVVKQDALKDLNLDMPMGFGFIEGPTPDTDMTLQEAQQKMDAGIQRVKEEEAQKNLLRSQGRGFGTPVMADQFLAGGGIAKMAGDSSGRPPVSGPNPQGLLSLKNRVRNY